MKPRQLVRRVAICIGLLASPLARAQTQIEPLVINPGARSLALGGAFVAVADDATAAYANPSGLVQLLRPEISAEVRTWSDDREGAASDLSGIGFASFVLPRQEWSLAIYGQTLASLEYPGVLRSDGGEGVPLSSLTIANVGVSAAVRLNDALSVGAGIAVFGGNSIQFGVDFPSTPTVVSTDETSIEAGVIAGGLWSLSDAWALGASYRSGADFRFSSGRQATLPDVLAAGARWRSAGGHATVAVEVERLGGIDDRVRLHLGGEWVFLSAKPLIGLRAGVWHDPSGGVSALDTGSGPSAEDGETHASAGIGIALKRFQLDVGADVSESTTIGSISAIFTF
jgi:long-subunit fatty acid transport protein